VAHTAAASTRESVTVIDDGTTVPVDDGVLAG
jgi:hypothetical protein